MTRWSRLVALWVVAAQGAVSSLPAEAQIVRGTVLDTLSGAPVGHGFVVLLDSADREVMRTLSRADGVFAFQMPGPGVYRLRSERIGYRRSDSELFRVQYSTVHDVALQIASLAMELDAIEVVGETSCGDPTGEVDTGVLWEEARKALTAASWTANEGGYLHSLHLYRRQWNARRTDLEWEKIGGESGSARLPFIAISADSLAEAGYVARRGDVWDWYAPDANVLLDESFHRTHCFNAVRGDSEFAGMLGLKFEPVPDRNVPDIEGTLWIDEASYELRRIEYRYTDAPDNVRDDRLGGSIVFEPLPTGAWIVERWVIRLAQTELRRSRLRSQRYAPARWRLTGFRDRGGRVIELYDMEGTLLYQSPEMVEIYGQVFDSIRGMPLAEETVWIVGTDYQAVTDEDGQYFIHAILNGEYRLTTGRLDSLGYLSGRAGAVFAPGDTAQIDLAVPPRRTVQRDLCPEIGIPNDTRALVGLVRNPDGSPVVDVWVSAIWSPGADRTTRQMRRIKTDTTGKYVLCNVPIGRWMAVEVLLQGLDDAVVELRFLDESVELIEGGWRSTRQVPERILRLDLEVPNVQEQ